MLALPFEEERPKRISNAAVSPLLELGAYEALWDDAGATFKRLSEKFADRQGALPSDFVEPRVAREYAAEVMKQFREAKIGQYGVRVHGASEYPEGLRDAKYPVELIYYQGWWDLINSRCIAVVGARNPSKEGLKRTRQLVGSLVRDDFTIVSGLAAGIDREAHTTAIKKNGRTIAVLGTPLNRSYPSENRDLQAEIAKNFLLVSQVPVVRYAKQDHRINRAFFPERNKTMSALTMGTIIVEAAETSGTLTQAKAALEQGRALFILDSCFRSGLKWPYEFEKRGAIRVKEYADIQRALSGTTDQNRRSDEGGSSSPH